MATREAAAPEAGKRPAPADTGRAPSPPAAGRPPPLPPVGQPAQAVPAGEAVQEVQVGEPPSPPLHGQLPPEGAPGALSPAASGLHPVLELQRPPSHAAPRVAVATQASPSRADAMSQSCVRDFGISVGVQSDCSGSATEPPLPSTQLRLSRGSQTCFSGGKSVEIQTECSGSATATPVGLQRGAVAATSSLEDGRGRGGLVSLKTKLAIRDLVTEDHIPIKDVPKVICDVYVGMLQRAPTEAELITDSHIKEWICELGARDLHASILQFWKVLMKYGKERVKLHVGHDGTRRSDPKVGHHGELMQFLASYFDPAKGSAVWFLLSLRFTVGGSAAHTANALAVCLVDVGLLYLKDSADETRAFEFTRVPAGEGVLCTVQSDNTGSWC
jgi:hypothetical protein